MRVLITGAAGFLGSHLCERLLIDGHDVLGMDNFITGSPENLAHLAGQPGFSFIRHDVSNFIFVPGRVDAVMHFASPASPNPNSPLGYVNLPIQTMKAGALGTHNSLGVARAHNARFMLASTSEIYGDPLEHPKDEERSLERPSGHDRAVHKSPRNSRRHTEPLVDSPQFGPRKADMAQDIRCRHLGGSDVSYLVKNNEKKNLGRPRPP